VAPSEEIPPGYVAVARVLGAWGPRGELKVEPLAPADALRPGREVTVGGETTSIQGAGRSGRWMRLRLTGIAERQAAAGLRGEYLLVREDDLGALPEGQYYRFQLIGLRVVSNEGREMGRVGEVLSSPENDVFVVQGPVGELLLPATDEVIEEIDLESGTVTIEIIPGLLP